MTRHPLSLMRGGAVHGLLSRVGALRPRLRISRVLALLLVALAFVPLMLASAHSGTLVSGHVRIPLLADYALMFRLLLALPLLVVSAPLADRLLQSGIRQLVRGGFVRPSQQSKLQEILAHTRRLRDGWWPELIALLLAVTPLVSVRMPELAHLSSWHSDGHGGIRVAGLWFDYVSVPLFRFVSLLWLWRFLLWSWMLWRFSRLDLDLRPPHPDSAGGLGFIGLAQMRFSVLAVCGSLVLCGACINQFLYGLQSFHDMQHLLAGYVIGMSLILLAPALLLSGRMIAAKRHALAKYGMLAHRSIRNFDRRWHYGSGNEPLLIDSGNPSALADFASVHAAVTSMSIVPIGRRHLIGMLLASALPLVPLLFFTMSLDDLAAKLTSILV